jgi:hypothetical protein
MAAEKPTRLLSHTPGWGRKTLMTSLTANADLLALLGQVKELAVVRNDSGKVVGFFLPRDLYKAAVHAEAVRNADLVRVFRGQITVWTGHSTRQVFERLQSLAEDDEASRMDLQQKIDRIVEEDRQQFSRIELDNRCRAS